MKKLLPKDAILIPDNAEKVFAGQIFDVYQWPQTMFDGSTKTFEMLRRPDTVETIAVKDGKIVMIRDQQPGRPAHIVPPRGRTNSDDKIWLDTAKRELHEETGMQFKSWRLIEVTQPAAKIEWFVAVYLAIDFIRQDQQRLDAGGERIDVRLESVEEIRKLVLDGTYVSYLRPFFSRIHNLEELLALPEFAGRTVDRP